MSQFPIVDSLCKHDVFFFLFFLCFLCWKSRNGSQEEPLPKYNLNLKKTNAVRTHTPELLQNSKQKEKINKTKIAIRLWESKKTRERKKTECKLSLNIHSNRNILSHFFFDSFLFDDVSKQIHFEQFFLRLNGSWL